MKRITITELLAIYHKHNTQNKPYHPLNKFLCLCLTEELGGLTIIGLEDTIKEYFGRYFRFSKSHYYYGVMELWFSERDYDTNLYVPVICHDGHQIDMSGIKSTVEFRIKLMEYIIQIDPESCIEIHI